MPLKLKFLCAALFILTAVPRLNISLGPVPIYIVDICLFGAICFGGLRRPRIYGQVPLGGLLSTILAFALISEFLSAAFAGSYIEAIYMSSRTCLAIGLFFLVSSSVRNEDDLQYLLKPCVLGLIITTFLMTMTSLPGTRSMVAWIFKYDFLTPAGENFFFKSGHLEHGTRGQSLVGYNIISGWFVCLTWPLAIALYRSPLTSGHWRAIALGVSILAPFGVLFAYSRGALLGMLLLIFGLFLLGERHLKGQIAIAVIVVTGIIGIIGWNSKFFYFERIERRTLATIENPLGNEQEKERFASYIDPFIVVSENPARLFTGEGLATGRRARRSAIGRGDFSFFSRHGRNIADHSVFSQATMTYGMIAACCYLLLWVNALRNAYREARFSLKRNGLSRYFPQLVFPTIIGLSAWVAFDKGIIVQPRGAMMFFFVIGMVEVCRNLRIHYRLEQVKDGKTSDKAKHPIVN